MKYICVYGAVNEKIDDKYKQTGFGLGKKIANENYGLVFSGMKGGICGAVANAVAESPNIPIIGIMPKFFKEMKADEMFEKCTERFFTDNIAKRKDLMKEKSDAIIITPGGVGTFDELFDAIVTKRWGLMDKPIVIYNMENYFDNLIAMLDYAIETKFGRDNYKESYKVFDNLDDIFNYINNYKNQ